jgi:uncharacterized protein YjbI with pentapeptide repeats
LNLSGINFRKANLNRLNLTKSNLANADLTDADLRDASLYGCNLNQADLAVTKLWGTDLRYANLNSANLYMAFFFFADLSNATLKNATLTGTIFNDSKLENTVFENAKFARASFINVDLSNTKGIDQLIHEAPTALGVDTIYRSKGKIPESFLLGAGIPDNFIEYMSSLTGTAFDYYSCFISYSSIDNDFANRLYADLQNEGVRCWFAPEDLKIGDKIRQTIDQSIRIHDKLLLILSENSINSEWCEDEVEAAYEEERIRKTTVLFPLRIDDAVMDTNHAWAAKLRRSRNIGDFTNWKNHDEYQKAFERLLKDLKAES